MTKQTIKDMALDFLIKIVNGDIRDAYELYVGTGFCHHNPYFPSDAKSLRKGMEDDEARNPGKKLDVQNAMQDGNFVAIHSRLIRGSTEPDIAVVHIFRFENSRIVEVWDVAQVTPEQIVNNKGMF